MHLSYPNYLQGLLPIDLEIPEEFAQKILSDFPVRSFSSPEERFVIDNLKDGERFSNLLVSVSEYKEERTTKAPSKPYIAFTLGTSGGAVKAKLWDNNSQYKSGRVENCLRYLEKNNYMIVDGIVNEYPPKSGKKSLVIDNAKSPKEDIDAFSLLPTTSYALEALTVEFFYYLDVLNVSHKEFLYALFRKYWHEFSIKPGAKRHHHAFLGGLLQHTLGLLRIGFHITREPQKVEQKLRQLVDGIYHLMVRDLDEESKNRVSPDLSLDHLFFVLDSFHKSLEEHELDISNALLSIAVHDIGKIFEYTHDEDYGKFSLLFKGLEDSRNIQGKAIDVDPLGVLIGHMPFGTLMLFDFWKTNSSDFSLDELMKIFHNILAHHAKFEWGSPVRPVFPESWLICFCDYLDAKIEGKVN